MTAAATILYARRCANCSSYADVLRYCARCRAFLVTKLDLPEAEIAELKRPLPLASASRDKMRRCNYCKRIYTNRRDEHGYACCNDCWGR